MFQKLSIQSIKKRLIYSCLFTVFFLLLMAYFDGFLTNEICPYGIVSFQLAKDITVAKNIMNSWNNEATRFAYYSLWTDFLFMLCYGSFFAYSVLFLSKKVWKKSYGIALLMVKASFVAVFLDAIENIALLQLMTGNLNKFWSNIAYYFASIKFLILMFILLYILFSFIFFTKQKLFKK